MRSMLYGWTYHELQRIDEQLSRLGSFGRARGRRLSDAERDLGRVALVTRALGDLMIAKGLLTKEELLAAIERTDLEDGVADGAIDPKAVVPGTKIERAPTPDDESPPPHVLARARARVKTAREARPAPAPTATPEVLARAKEHLRAVREKKRGKNLP
ncbi:MAG: hypothetical protein K8S98_09485 [Planctomycetes bacterium]|nr:hypothetical protein [Planctomycetota bacterium]